jgi:hypothetical protein
MTNKMSFFLLSIVLYVLWYLQTFLKWYLTLDAAYLEIVVVDIFYVKQHTQTRISKSLSM